MNYAEFSLIRFGTGLSSQHTGPADPDELLQSLTDKTVQKKFPGTTTAEMSAAVVEFESVRSKRNKGDKEQAEYRQMRQEMTRKAHYAYRVRVARAIDAPVGFSDRLAQFWSGHFNLKANKKKFYLLNESFREDISLGLQTGRFADMLRAATLHPAMLKYLNQASSVGPNSVLARRAAASRSFGLNENLARELMELHTLGVGSSYNQNDVRQLAELLTGLTVDNKKYATYYDTRLVEPGAETVLGKEYGGAEEPEIAEIESFLDDLAVHPQTAAHISRKLATHFCADTPPEALVKAMTDRFVETGGELMAVYDVMIRHDEAWQSFGQKVRQPWDFIIAGFRALGITGDNLYNIKLSGFRRYVINPLERMGQSILGAPQPNGWPEDAEDWLSPQLLAVRIDWSMHMAQSKFIKNDLADIKKFVQAALTPEAAAVVGPVVQRAESRNDAAGLVLASPEFNRR